MFVTDRRVPRQLRPLSRRGVTPKDQLAVDSNQRSWPHSREDDVAALAAHLERHGLVPGMCLKLISDPQRAAVYHDRFGRDHDVVGSVQGYCDRSINDPEPNVGPRNVHGESRPGWDVHHVSRRRGREDAVHPDGEVAPSVHQPIAWLKPERLATNISRPSRFIQTRYNHAERSEVDVGGLRIG